MSKKRVRIEKLLAELENDIRAANEDADKAVFRRDTLVSQYRMLSSLLSAKPEPTKKRKPVVPHTGPHVGAEAKTTGEWVKGSIEHAEETLRRKNREGGNDCPSGN
jgi:hypothetical protein